MPNTHKYNACEGCHKAKVRCEYPVQDSTDSTEDSTGCMRCLRLDQACLPRISRQGQGPKKRRRNHQLKEEHEKKSEDEVLLHAFLSPHNNNNHNGRHHYGIRYLIHSWISFALARRSFDLMGRACRLAARCGVPMDEVFTASRRSILDPLIYHNTRSITTTRTPLAWSDLPKALLKACSVEDASSLRDDRYIWIREAFQGESRFLLSRAFQRDICDPWLVEQTWKANDRPVVQLFLEGAEDFTKFTRAIEWQTARMRHPHTPPEFVRVHEVRVKFVSNESSSSGTATFVRDMDLLYAFEIVTLEHSFYLAELVVPEQPQQQLQAPPLKQPQSVAAEEDMEAAAVATETNTNQTNQRPSLLLLDDQLDALTDDEELQVLLSLISGD